MGTTDFNAETNGKRGRTRPRTKWVPRISMRKPMARGQKGDPAQNGYHGFPCKNQWKEGKGETPHKMGTTDFNAEAHGKRAKRRPRTKWVPRICMQKTMERRHGGDPAQNGYHGFPHYTVLLLYYTIRY
jgi:hypothetical protein